MSKTFEVEIKRTSYIVITVDAENADEAETKAWQRIEEDNVRINDADWELESVEEVSNQ